MPKTYLYDIVDPDPHQINAQNWEALFRIMRESTWYQHPGERMGFVSISRRDRMIGGYFANESRKKVIQYDENKEQVEPRPSYSFEHLFFALFEDTAQLLLQSRNIYDYVDLSLPVMRRNFLNLLGKILRLANVYVVGETMSIESAGITHTAEQLYGTFTGIAQVLEIEISDLSSGVLPSPDDPRYRLFNPKAEWDPITWGAVADTLKSGLDHVEMSSCDDTESTLQSPIPKALAAVGSIERIKGYDEEGRVVIRSRTDDAELEVELPTTPTVSPELLDRIFDLLEARGRTDSWQERRRRRRGLQDRGHLFDDLE